MDTQWHCYLYIFYLILRSVSKSFHISEIIDMFYNIGLIMIRQRIDTAPTINNKAVTGVTAMTGPTYHLYTEFIDKYNESLIKSEIDIF